MVGAPATAREAPRQAVTAALPGAARGGSGGPLRLDRSARRELRLEDDIGDGEAAIVGQADMARNDTMALE